MCQFLPDSILVFVSGLIRTHLESSLETQNHVRPDTFYGFANSLELIRTTLTE